MKIYKYLSIILILFSAVNLLAQEKAQELTDAEKTRLAIQDSLKKIQEKSQKAKELFNEAKIEADNLKAEAERKLEYLKEAIEKAKTIKSINKEGLAKAVKLKDQAEVLYKEHEYKKVIELVKEALTSISKIPIVSIQVTPPIFSPDGDGRNDTLTITPEVFSVTKVVRWVAAVSKQEEGEDKSIELKKWQGQGLPPETVEWDGQDDGKVTVDSASSYFAELVAVDENGAVVSSGKVKFKTDIFVRKTERGLIIDISSISFDYNKADLKDQYKPTIKLVYDYLLRYPEYSIAIEGHTDASGKAPKNKVLSDERAQSVAKYLNELGMDEKRLQTYGLGEAIPKTLDKNKMGLNRRVAFILMKSDDDILEYKHYIKALKLNDEVQMNK